MKDSEKAKEISIGFSIEKLSTTPIQCCKESALEMAQWKDEQYKIAYVVTRSDLHYDEVEKVFFDKSKAEEYCKSFNEDKNIYHRNITEIEISL